MGENRQRTGSDGGARPDVLELGTWLGWESQARPGTARNQLSGDQRCFLDAGGQAFIIGDGALNYAPQSTVEAYYSRGRGLHSNGRLPAHPESGLQPGPRAGFCFFHPGALGERLAEVSGKLKKSSVTETHPASAPVTEQHPATKGLRSSRLGMLLNLVLAITKGVAGYLGHSFALVADALESLADVLSSMVVYYGLRKAIEPPDENHPYGHGKFEPIAAVVVALSLGVAGVTIAFESVHEILTSHRSPAPFTLVVLAGVLIVKEALYYYVAGIGESIASTAVKTDAWHHRSDAITSGLAFVGISIALLGGKGYETADKWAALVAACVILFNAWRYLRPALAELTDVAPADHVLMDLRTVAMSVPGVVALDKSFVRKMGFDYYVDLHIVVNGDLPVREGHRIAHEVKDAIRFANPRVAEVLIHVEPAG